MNEYKQIVVSEIADNLFLGEMKIKNGKSFNLDLLNELSDFFMEVFNKTNNNGENRVFAIMGEKNSGVFNVGGDLKLFLNLVEHRDSLSLLRYGENCIKLIEKSLNAKNHNMTTAAIINGNALGGGFESALACDIIIAEEDFEIALPEVRLGFFPGMGAFELLSKRIGPQQTKKFILEGKTFKTNELYEMGVFDYLVKQNSGVEKLKEVIKKERKFQVTNNSIRKINDRQSPIKYEDLRNTLDLWIESILNISNVQKKLIKKTIEQQNKKFL